MKQQLEEVIKKNLPEKKKKSFIKSSDIGMDNDAYKHYSGIVDGFNQAISKINPSIIADEVLKVVVENERQRIGQEMDLIWRDTHHDLNLFEQAICELQEDLLFNSSILEGEQSEHLSPNNENKNK